MELLRVVRQVPLDIEHREPVLPPEPTIFGAQAIGPENLAKRQQKREVESRTASEIEQSERLLWKPQFAGGTAHLSQEQVSPRAKPPIVRFVAGGEPKTPLPALF